MTLVGNPRSKPNLFPPPRPRRKRPDEIAESLKDWIVDHKVNPGERLPQERELIKQFSASKGTIREALKSLETQGLIYTRPGPGGGVFVGALSGDRAMELLSNYFFFRQPSIGDIYAIRKKLEPELAASVVGHLSDDDYRRLEETMRIYNHPAANLGEEYQQRIAELDFHTVLAELCPNPVLGFVCGFMQNLLRDLTLCRRIYDKPNPELREHAMHYQVRLLHALRDEDQDEAREIMYDHMCAAHRYMEACEAEYRGAFLRFDT